MDGLAFLLIFTGQNRLHNVILVKLVAGQELNIDRDLSSGFRATFPCFAIEVHSSPLQASRQYVTYLS